MITNQQDQIPQNSHSRVIYKNFNDTDTQDFLNSYRYEPSRNRKYKKWKPDISPEERFKKKRDREEEYLQNFHPEDRPVLVVQRKDEYQDIENPNIFMDPQQKEAYYKVSENTDTVDDITYAIKQIEGFIKRHTVVHKKNSKTQEENLSSIYKVEGKEFLPEGFIELDPLLYKDEYEFDNKLDAKRFEEEQRKLKMLRRKQYEQRNDNKIRDVTIYVMDEQKNRTLIFLEKWVNQHRRKMNDAELEYVSENLQVNPHKLKKLQDLYFKKMEILRNRQFGTYQNLKGQNQLRDMPQGIRSQFQQKKFDDIDSKYMKSQEPLKPTFLNKYQKKPIKKNKPKKSNQNSQLIDTEELDQTLKESSQDKVQHQQNKGNSYSQLHKQKYNKQNSNNNDKKSNANSQIKTSRDNFNKQKSSDTFGQETFRDKFSQKQSIDRISLKTSKDKFSQQQSKDRISQQQALSSKNSKQFVQSKQSQNIDDLHNPFEQILNNNDNLKQKESLGDTQKQIQNQTKQNFENDLQKYFDDEINQILNKINDAGENNSSKNKKENPNEQSESKEYVDTFKQKLIENDENLRHLVNGNNKPTNRKKQKSEVQNVSIQKLPKRLTIFAQNQNGDLKNTFKLKPIVLGNEYFYQTIEQKYNNDRTKEATLTTKNDQGQILDKYEIPSEDIGRFYENEVLDKQPEFQGDQGKKVVVKNDRNKTIHTQIIRPRQEQLLDDDLENQLEIENFKKEIVQEDQYIKVHKLNPIVFNNKEIKQVIEEIKDEKNNEQINVLTYDDNNEILQNKKIKPFLKSENYYSEIQIVQLDNKKKLTLLTKNKEGQIVSEYQLENIRQNQQQQYMNNQTEEQDDDTVVYNLNPVIVGNRILKQEIHLPKNKKEVYVKTFNDYNDEIESQKINPKMLTKKEYSELSDENNSLKLLTKNQNGKTLATFTLPEEYNKIDKNQKFDEIIEIVDNEGQRRATVATKLKNDKQFRCYQLRPTLIGNQFYQQTINELIEDQDKKQKAILITKNEDGEVLDTQEIDSEKIAQDYYNQIVNENINQQGKRKITLVTYNNNNEEVGRVELTQSLSQKIGDEHYKEVIEQIVNEDENDKEQIDLIKIDDKNDKVEVHQIQVDQNQQQELEDIDNLEYFEKLNDIFGDKKPKRSFAKNDGQIYRDKAQTYAQIPLDYKGPQMLTQESKKQIDQFVREIKEEQEQYLSNQNDIQEQNQQSDNDQNDQKNNDEEDQQQDNQYEEKNQQQDDEMDHQSQWQAEKEQDLQTRKNTQNQKSIYNEKDETPEQLIYRNTIANEPRDTKYQQNKRTSITTQNSRKYDPVEGYKKAHERVKSKTKTKKTSKKKSNQPISFEEMEKKMKKLEKQNKIPDSETRSKQTSVVGNEFKPSLISKIYEDKYGSNQRGSERFNKQDVGVRDYSKTFQPLGKRQNLLESQVQDEIQEKQSNLDNDISIMENKEFLKTEKEIHDVIESQKNLEKNLNEEQAQSENDKEQSREEKKYNDLPEEKQDEEQEDLQEQNNQQKGDQQERDQQEDQQEQNQQEKQNLSSQDDKDIEKYDTQNEEEKQTSIKNIESKKSIQQQSKKSIKQQSKKSLPKIISSKRNTIQAEDQVIFEGLKEKQNPILQEILKKKNEDQKIQIKNKEDDDDDDEYGSNITPKDLNKSFASAVTHELERQVDRDVDLVDRLSKAAGLSRGELLQDFYDFCVRLPRDKKYKESIVFATMFYYYMQKKKKEI